MSTTLNLPHKNESELLLEEYLAAHGLNRWDFEPDIKGKSQRPDYRVWLDETPLFFEVKKFRRDPREPLPTGPSYYDPYPPIREKINAAREKFQNFKEFSCSLVLHNVDAWLVHLSDPLIMMSAMLGDFGFQFPVNLDLGTAVGEPTWAFLKRGKMIDYKRMQPQNTTINAIIVLEHFRLGMRRLRLEWKRKESELNRQLSMEEFLRFAETLKAKGMSAEESLLRVLVYENPYARIPLTREIFTGLYDERFGSEGDHMMRVFAGDKLLELETAAGEHQAKE
jgi:hypothetical protein